jgi:hypothetical protein
MTQQEAEAAARASRDVLAWVVRFSIPMGRWVELTIDDRNGELVRKAHSR